MKALLSWIDQRTGLSEAVRKRLAAPIPGGASWSRIWPATILFAFCVQVITGLFLWMYYSPSAQSAWESVYYLQYHDHVTGGWLLRAVHHWSAQVMLVLIGVYLIQMIVTGAYRAPRELVFWVALFLGLVCLALLLTGDLLAWDQNSYASTKVRVSFLELLPWIGGGLFKLAAGGPEFGHLTLTRFVALHIGVFSGIFLLLLILHGLLVRRADSAETTAAEKTDPFWPPQAVRNALAMMVVLVVILLLSVRHGVSGDQRGVALGSPADTNPANSFKAARPEWAFLGLYQFSNLFPGELKILPIFVIPGLLVCVALAMPWIARHKGGHRFNMGFTGVLLVGVVVLSFVSVWKNGKDEKHEQALKAEDKEAARVRELMRARQGAPARGALSLLQTDPQTAGPKLYGKLCKSCHNYGAPEDEEIATENPSAPELYRFAGREWIAGLLDPEQIKTSRYFGNSAFRGGDMVGFVEDTFSDMDQELGEERDTLVIALSAEARLPSQIEMDQNDADRIEEGRQLIVDYCTQCHRFHENRASDAPDLTGYGSRQWTMDIISDPQSKRFYPDSNDGMPSYFKFPEDPRKNLLTERQVRVLADFIRGRQEPPEE